MKKVFILVNNIKDYTFKDLVKKYLKGIKVDVGTAFPSDSDKYDLVVPWCYKKKIAFPGDRRNVIVFHSTDLPKGKGWAPIYYTLARGEKKYTISGIIASDKVDAGDIVVKARFGIKDNYTADIIREWDFEIMIMLIKKMLNKFRDKKLAGTKQKGKSSWFPRRYPEDSEIKPGMKQRDLINHLRACEKRYPAFFYLNKTKYFVHIEPAIRPEFPKDLEVEFFDPA